MSGPIFFIKLPKPGAPLCLRGIAQGLARLEHAWKNLSVHKGHVEWFGHEPKIVMDADDTQQSSVEECDVTVSGQTFTIADGELIIGTRRFVVTGCTADGTSASIGDYRWVYVKIDANGGTSPSGEITDDELKALDSFTSTEQFLCVNLSKWVKSSAGWLFVCKAKAELHQHGTMAG